MSKLQIACVKWGDKFTANDVNVLYNQVKRNVTLDFDFICYTDNNAGIDNGIQTRGCHSSLQGWWQKLYLFGPQCGLSGRVFFLDLDTLIVDNIDHLLTRTEPFILLRDVFYGVYPSVDINDCGSAIMLWDHEEYTDIYNSFISDYKNNIRSLKPHGDQRWIQKRLPVEQRVFWQDLFPEQVVSFKVSCREGLPLNTKIVCFHGKPSIQDAITKKTVEAKWTIEPQIWIKEYWR